MFGPREARSSEVARAFAWVGAQPAHVILEISVARKVGGDVSGDCGGCLFAAQNQTCARALSTNSRGDLFFRRAQGARATFAFECSSGDVRLAADATKSHMHAAASAHSHGVCCHIGIIEPTWAFVGGADCL